MKKFAVVAVLALCLIAPSAAQEKLEDLAKTAPSRAKYPDSSAVVVRAGEVFTLAPAGGSTHEYFRALEVFNLTGREKFSDFRIPFDKNSEKVEVILAKTIKGDGTVVDVEPKAINDVTPPELAEADLRHSSTGSSRFPRSTRNRCWPSITKKTTRRRTSWRAWCSSSSTSRSSGRT